MSDYGVLSTGFNRKPLAQILADIQSGVETVFGPGVIQTSQSPLGQINGLMADLAAQCWEMAEDVYQSYDPDQAEGVRLDMLAKMRLLSRTADELDSSFRQAVTNAGRARIDIQDLLRAVQNVDGVTYAQVFINDTGATDSNGLSAHSVSVAVLGGDDEEIAQVIREYVVPGVGTSGNTRIETTIDGYCRTVFFSRPVEVPITLTITVIRRSDRLGCPPAALEAIAEGLLADLQGDRKPINGEDISEFIIRSAIESRYPNVEVVGVTGSRSGDATMPLAIDFDEIASFSLDNITILNAS